MTKAELVDKMAKDAGISKVAATAALGSFMDGVVKALKKKDGKVTLVGFGTFSKGRRKARKPKKLRRSDIARLTKSDLIDQHMAVHGLLEQAQEDAELFRHERDEAHKRLTARGRKVREYAAQPKLQGERLVDALDKKPELLREVMALLLDKGFVAGPWLMTSGTGTEYVRPTLTGPFQHAEAAMVKVDRTSMWAWEVWTPGRSDVFGSADGYSDHAEAQAEADEALTRAGWVLL